jgi:hypothetical protein
VADVGAATTEKWHGSKVGDATLGCGAGSLEGDTTLGCDATLRSRTGLPFRPEHCLLHPTLGPVVVHGGVESDRSVSNTWLATGVVFSSALYDIGTHSHWLAGKPRPATGSYKPTRTCPPSCRTGIGTRIRKAISRASWGACPSLVGYTSARHSPLL